MSTKLFIAGVDDATKCPCIGSIFVAGVVADAQTIEYWQQIGVKDSKLIAFKRRNELAAIIKETAAHFSIAEITPAMIDDKRLNLNAWEMITLLKIVQDLQQSTLFSDVYVDNWEVTLEHFRHRFTAVMDDALQSIHQLILMKEKLTALNFIAEHRADENHIIVGAASILAKSASDAQYAAYKELYGDFGSGSPGDPKTRHFVWTHRHNPLPIIRTSWQTYKTLALLNNIHDDYPYSRRSAKKNTISVK